MITFDRVLPELIRICHEDSATREVISRYCVVRDVRGRVRLIAEPTAPSPSLDALESALVAALGAYFVPPIVSSKSKALTEQRLAKHFLDLPKRSWPGGWPHSYRNVLGGADTPIGVGTRWTGIERTIGKEAWLATKPPKPPWPLSAANTPPIVTFHSFKGGVGRTTLVAAYALWLANKEPRCRVAIVDLDLEAPGIGMLFSAESERGVLGKTVTRLVRRNRTTRLAPPMTRTMAEVAAVRCLTANRDARRMNASATTSSAACRRHGAITHARGAASAPSSGHRPRFASLHVSSTGTDANRWSQ